MQWDAEEQRIRARFSELRQADREKLSPGFEEVSRAKQTRMHWQWAGVAAALLILVTATAAFVWRGGNGNKALADWPDIELVVPEQIPSEDSPTAPLLTYLDETAGTRPGEMGLD